MAIETWRCELCKKTRERMNLSNKKMPPPKCCDHPMGRIISGTVAFKVTGKK